MEMKITQKNENVMKLQKSVYSSGTNPSTGKDNAFEDS
jgi:hypothetical protein